MTARAALLQAAASLKAAGCATPRLDAEVLLMHARGLSRAQVLAHLDEALDDMQALAFAAMLARRQRREPVAYIVGEKEFWSRPFKVNASVLIPRPETEHLIEAAIEYFPDTDRPYRFCDIGTGSGCIAVTLACEYPEAEITATDVSAAALVVARENANRHGVAGRIRFRLGDMFTPLPADGRFDAIVCNPPYVAVHDMATLAPELAFEPRGALTDEADGRRYLELLLQQSGTRLKSDGYLIVETGGGSLPQPPRGLPLQRAIHDLAGHVRGGVYRRAERHERALAAGRQA